MLMRASFEQIEVTGESAWKQHVRRLPVFPFEWHFHREAELTLITEGSGSRFAGDCIETYGPGDLTLIGPGLPHTYMSAAGPPVHEAVVAQFRRDFLGPGLFGSAGLAPIAGLLDRSAQGLAFTAAARDRAGAIMRAMPELPACERTVALLQVLTMLARDDSRPLASDHYAPVLGDATRLRIDAVCRYIHARYTEPITLGQVAEVAHLSPVACSRFFHRAMGRTLTTYLNELRVGAACRLLADTDLPIAEAAAMSGYQNLSNFNRRFRELKRMSPRDYRARFQDPPAPDGN